MRYLGSDIGRVAPEACRLDELSARSVVDPPVECNESDRREEADCRLYGFARFFMGANPFRH
ncbi:MAG TPA: hypothetical protein VFE72_03085 [Lysobacter sp.]|nr:hypothetical protein [Lysobacter sp.]